MALTDAEKQAAYRERKRQEKVVRRRAEELSREMLARYPGRHTEWGLAVESGRADAAVRYMRMFEEA